MAEAGRRNWKRWTVAGLLLSSAIGVGLAHTEILRWSINRFALADSGLAITRAEELAVDPGSLFSGRPDFRGRGLELQHAALPHALHLASIDGSAALGDGPIEAVIGIGPYRGALSADRRDGALQRLAFRIDGRDSSAINASFSAGRPVAGGSAAALPRLRVEGRRAAPILAALFARDREELASLPDQIDISLSPTADERLTVGYRLRGAKLDIAGRGEADFKAATVVHSGAVRWQRSDDEADAENAIGAAQEQLTLVAEQAAPMLERFTLRSDLALTLIDPQGREGRYDIGLTGAGPSARGKRSLGRLILGGRAAPQAAPVTLLDATIERGEGDNRLALIGRTVLAGAIRPVSLRLMGADGEPIDKVMATIGTGGPKSQASFDLDFVNVALGSGTTLRIAASGTLPALRVSAQDLASVGDAVRILTLLDQRDAAALTFAGQVELTDEAILLDGFKLSSARGSVTLDGKLGSTEAGTLGIDADFADLDLGTPARQAALTAAAQRLAAAFADPKAPTPSLDVKAAVRSLRLPGQLLRELTIAYDADEALKASVGALLVGRETVLSDGSLTLPLEAGAVLVAEGTTRWGAATASYRPADGRSIETLLARGGQAELALPGLKVAGALPPGLRGETQFRLAVARPAEAPWLKTALGPGLEYWPDEPVAGTARLSFGPAGASLRSLSVKSSAVSVSAAPAGGDKIAAGKPLRVALSGRLRDFLRDPSLLPSPEFGNQRADASFLLRSAGNGYAFDDVRASVGALRLDGAVAGRSASDLQGRLTIRAARAGEAAALFPSVLGMLPPDMLGYPLVMPVELRGSPRGVALRATSTKLGPLSIASDVGVSGTGDGETTAKVVISGPIATTFLADTPPWMRDLLGARQTLTADLTINPRRAIEARTLELSSDRIRMRGRIDLPMRGGDFDWSAARGELAGDIDSFQWKAIDLPKGRYEFVLKGAEGGNERMAATIAFPSVYGGTVNARLALGGVSSTSQGRVELSVRNVNLAEACRYAGFRLFGAGRLDGELRGAAPVAAFLQASESGSLVEELLRTAAGTGRIAISGGALNNIDLSKRTATGDANGGVAAGARTLFDELGGSLTLRDGVLRIDGGRFQTTGYSLSISGATQLPRMAMDLLVKGQVAVLSRVSTGRTLISAPILPLAIRGTPDKPSYEFLPGQLPGTRALTNAVVEGAKTAGKIDASMAGTQKKVDKYFSDKFFRPLVGRKKPPQPAAATDAGPTETTTAPVLTTTPICGA